MVNKRLNLMPSDLAVSAKTLKFTKIISNLSIIGVVFLIISIISAIVLFIIYSNQLKKIDASVLSLKNEISSLEKSEQKLILVKDKLEKISYIKSLSSAENDINQFRDLNDIVKVSSNSAFTEINIGSSITEVSLKSENSSFLSQILDSFSKLKNYTKITLSSLGFNQSTGFSLSLFFESK